MLHLGPPHTSNDAYAYSKRILEIQQECINISNINQDAINKCTESLIEEAKNNGGNDNISVISIAAV